jgi:hypothetical protein
MPVMVATLGAVARIHWAQRKRDAHVLEFQTMKTLTTISMIAAVATGLGAMASAAAAQTGPQPAAQPMDQSVAQASDPSQAAPNASAPPAAATAVPDQVQTPAAGATMVAATVTNGPVPDTAANRAKYGAPMSHAGKKSAPAGN